MAVMPADLELVEAIAERVVELLAARDLTLPVARPRLLTCRQVAETLGRSAEWVRDHRDEIGLVPGTGDRPRLLFDATAVEAWATAGAPPTASPAAVRSPATRRRGPSRTADLLPIRGAVVPLAPSQTTRRAA